MGVLWPISPTHAAISQPVLGTELYICIQILIPRESDVPVPCSMFVFQREECWQPECKKLCWNNYWCCETWDTVRLGVSCQNPIMDGRERTVWPEIPTADLAANTSYVFKAAGNYFCLPLPSFPPCLPRVRFFCLTILLQPLNNYRRAIQCLNVRWCNASDIISQHFSVHS